MKMKLLFVLLFGLFLFSCKEDSLQEQNLDALLDNNTFSDSLYNRMLADPGFIELCDLSHGLDSLSFYPALDNYEQSKETLHSFYALAGQYCTEHEIEDLFIYIEKYNQKYSLVSLSRVELEEVLFIHQNEIVAAWNGLWREYESMESGLIGSYNLRCVRQKFSYNMSGGMDASVVRAMKFVVTENGVMWRNYTTIQSLRDLFIVKSGLAPGSLLSTLEMMRSRFRAFWTSGQINSCYSPGWVDETPDPGKDPGELTPEQILEMRKEYLKNELGLDVKTVSLDPFYEVCKLNEQELELVLKYPFDAIKIRDNAKFVRDVVVEAYGFNGHNDVTDAFRHCFFAALNSITCGTILANRFGDAHEAEPGQPLIEKQMDLYNNSVGYDIIKNDTKKQVTKDNLKNHVADAVNNGKLKFIKGDKLVPSNTK